jgi:putative ABC transport system permease protein
VTAAVGAARLFLQRVRFDPGPPLAILALVGATCFVFAALPRLANGLADDGLRYTVAQSPVASRNVRTLETDRLASLEGIAERANRSEQELPPELRALAGGSTFVARSPRYLLQSDTEAASATNRGLVRYLSLRLHSGIGSHIKVLKGRLPRATDARVRAEATQTVFFGQVQPLSWRSKVPLVEVALSAETAKLLRLRVDDRAVFMPDLNDLPVQRVPIRDERPLVVHVVGLIAVKKPQEEFWFADATLNEPEVRQSPDLEEIEIFGQALVAEGQYTTMLEATKPLPLAYEYRHFLDPQRLDAAQLGSLRDASAQLDARYAGAGALERKVEIGLTAVLDRYDAARAQAQTLLAVAAIGLFACALANIGLLAALTYSRRRSETGVARTRGASSSQVLAAQAAEGLLIAAPAGFLGWLLAVAAIGGRTSGLSGWLALALVCATVALLVAAIVGVARRPLGPLGREDVVLARPSPRRLALEGLVAAAAALGVYLLRRRGLGSDAVGGFDPYLAAVPVLLGVACGILALRLYPLPIAAAVRLTRRARGLVLHLGLSRAARQSDIGAAPLLVLVLALGIAGFSAAMLRTLDDGQNRTAWRVVGADVRVDAPLDGTLPPALVSRLESLGDVAAAYVEDPELGAAGEATPVVAVDLKAYERLVAGTPAAVRFPRELHEPPIPGLVPGLVSTDWPAPGTFQIEDVNVLTIGDRASFPGIPAGTPFAIVPLGALEEATGTKVAPSRLYLRGVAESAVREALRDAAPRAQLASRADVVRGLRASPLVDDVFRGFRAAIVLAALYAAVAVALMALIAARSRSRDLALVRTMGASPRQSIVLAAVELAPFVLTALVLGIGLGIAIPHLVAPGLDFAFFTGNDDSTLVTSWVAPAVSAAAVLLLIGATVLVIGFRTRRAGLDRVLRMGER